MTGTGTGIRVLDLTGAEGAFGARLLVGLDADVIRIVPPGQDAGSADARRAELHWHAGKRLAILDPADAASSSELDRLAADADILLAGRPGLLDRFGLTPQQARARWEHLVVVVASGFGLTGPRRNWLAPDLVACALGGMTSMSGEPGRVPLTPPREQGYHVAGTQMVIGALLGLLARRRTGHGQLVDVSLQESVASSLELGAISYIHTGQTVRRNGNRYQHVPQKLFRCADGFLAGGFGGSPRMWTDLLGWLAELGMAEDLTDPRWSSEKVRSLEREHIYAVLDRFCAGFTKAEFAAEAERRRLAWAAVDTPAEVLANPQLLARGFFTEVTDGAAAWPDAGFAVSARAQPAALCLPAAAAGPAVTWRERVPKTRDGQVSRRPATGGRRAAGPGSIPPKPLEGLRVVDLTWVLAGPYATRILADFGAEVIKVESRFRPDPTRFASAMHLSRSAAVDPDTSGYFNNLNRGKQSVLLNLRTDEGRSLLRRLISVSDVVIDNFSAGVLDRWGLSHAELRRDNPAVIKVTMAGLGQHGPMRARTTYADALAAMAGLTAQTGEPGRDPTGVTFGLGDIVAANHAVIGVLHALHRRAGSGAGCHVDLSQLEALVSQLGTALLDAQDGMPPCQPGNRHPAMAPHGVYPCAGDDAWCAIAVQDDSQWLRLASLAGQPLAGDQRLATMAGRKAREDELDAALARWTARHEPGPLTAMLQEAGVPAGTVQDGRDLVEADEQLAARGFYVTLDHPAAGPFRHEGAIPLLSETPGSVSAPAPRLGEHTRSVLSRLCGLTGSELDALERTEILA